MKKVLKFIFNQKAFYILLMLIQIAFLVWSIYFLSKHFAFVYLFIIIIDVLLFIYVSNGKDNPAYKIVWLTIIALLPIFGGLMYILMRNNAARRIYSKSQIQFIQSIKGYLPNCQETINKLDKDNKDIANLSRYIYNNDSMPIYNNTDVEYYPIGESWFNALINELEKAEKFIFMEFFIITKGFMWNKFTQVLIEKAKSGVEVRLMYDGMGTGFVTDKKYFKQLENAGIKTKEFNPFRPFLSSIQNNRDHRKITVIDGKVGFTGGTNLSDEYINLNKRFGHWKDTAVCIKGEAVESMTAMFMQLWENGMVSKREFNKYVVPKRELKEYSNEAYVQPYGDSPLDNENVGKLVYIELINMAKEKVYIMTPYLIIDNELLTALELAAKRGIDVRLILPHVPDKWYVYKIAWIYYEKLIDVGVKIYEYEPGFVHAKEFLVDDKVGVVGTINLDYRSLYLHFECATLFYNCKAVEQLRNDFTVTYKKCIRITKQDCKKRSVANRVIGNLLALFAPLL